MNSKAVADLLHNDFDAVQNKHPEKLLLRSGATVVHTCGSGPAIYAFYKSRKTQQQAFAKLKKQMSFIWKNA